MTWLVPQLKERVQIGKPDQSPNDDGGFDFSFDVVSTIWMGFLPSTFQGRGSSYVRGEQINESVTHILKARRNSVESLGRGFTSGFSNGFDSIADLGLLKSEYFLFVQRGSTVKGRLFRIHDVTDNKEQREYLNISAEEIEERGTGYGI